MIDRTTLRVAVCALFLAVSSSAAAQSPADEPASSSTPEQREEARTRYARGIELYNEEEYKLALIEFERAYATAPSYRMLYNIGQVRAQLGQYTKAVSALERYVAEGATRISPQRMAEVKRDLATIRARTAKVLVHVTQPGAEITLDGERLSASPMTAHELINAGEHRLVVAKKGYKTDSRAIVLAGGDEVKVDVSLVVEEAPEKTLRVVDGAETVGPPPNRTPMWIAWGATGVLAAGAGAFALLTMNSASDLDRLRATRGSTQSERDDAAGQVHTYGLVADGLAIGAVVGAGIATYLTLRKGEAPTRARGVRLSGSASSFTLGGHF
jgi:hypothetical protein